MSDALVARVGATLATPVADAVSTFARRLADGGAARAVLFYGSNLRTGSLDGVLDFYLLTGGPVERGIWPTVGYREETIGGATLRAGVGGTVNSYVEVGSGAAAFDTQGFNVFGGIEMSKRDPVMHSELKGKGDLALTNQWNNLQGGLSRFTPDSVASPFGSYYRVPASNAGSTSIDGRTVGNSSPFGANYLGTYPGCPPELTVGQGTPARPDGLLGAVDAPAAQRPSLLGASGRGMPRRRYPAGPR